MTRTHKGPPALYVGAATILVVMSIGAVTWWQRSLDTPAQDTVVDEPVVEVRMAPRPANLNDFRPDIAARIRDLLARVGRRPSDAAAWHQLAVLYDAHQLYPVAKLAYERSVELDESAARSWYGLAFVRRELGDLEGACAAVDRVRTLAPDYTPAHCRAGFWQLDLGNLDASEE